MGLEKRQRHEGDGARNESGARVMWAPLAGHELFKGWCSLLQLYRKLHCNFSSGATVTVTAAHNATCVDGWKKCVWGETKWGQIEA